jgi:hypothetical protein
MKSKKIPSFRTAFFADPESMFFNGLLDTGLRRYDEGGRHDVLY